MELREATEKVIDLAKRAQKYWESELPKRHPSYPIIKPGEEEVKPPPQEKELRTLLTRLPTDTLYQLALLMSLGKMELETTEVAEGLENLKQHFDDPKFLAMYMAQTIPLATYLTDGLTALKRDRIDLAKMFPNGNTPAKSKQRK